MLDMDFYNYISLSIEDCNFNDRNKNDIAIQDILHFPLYLWINSAVVCIYETKKILFFAFCAVQGIPRKILEDIFSYLRLWGNIFSRLMPFSRKQNVRFRKYDDDFRPLTSYLLKVLMGHNNGI